MALSQNHTLKGDGPGDDYVRREAYERAKMILGGKKLFSDTRVGAQRAALVSDAVDTIGVFHE